jgi:hypothetical protein
MRLYLEADAPLFGGGFLFRGGFGGGFYFLSRIFGDGFFWRRIYLFRSGHCFDTQAGGGIQGEFFNQRRITYEHKKSMVSFLCLTNLAINQLNFDSGSAPAF